jgi:endonuclease IV
MSKMVAINLSSLNGGVFLQVRDELEGVSDHLDLTAHTDPAAANKTSNATKASDATKSAAAKSMTKVSSDIWIHDSYFSNCTSSVGGVLDI